MEMKLGDFGLAAKLDFDTEMRHTVCGTPNYIAPEILENKAGHSYQVDVWSLGVVIYTLVVGRPPFETPEVKSTYKKIKMCVFSFPEHIPLSDNVKNMISNILKLDPAKRPTLEELINHPFINKGKNIPPFLPLSTLACPPSKNYINQFIRAERERNANAPGPQGPGHSQENDQGNPQLTNGEGKTAGTSNVQTYQKGQSSKNQRQGVYVLKWVDYSSKYGLGYLLSNDCSGVFFNDCTKVVINPKTEIFHYIERRASDKTDVVTAYKLSNYPKSLHKKMTLLQHFRSYLEGTRTNITTYSENATPLNLSKEDESMIYLKKWMKTKHAIMFRLSNRIVQVDFQDKTQIILSSESKLVTYVDKRGEKSDYPIATALESKNAEMAKRLKYTKEILTHMLTSKQVKNTK